MPYSSSGIESLPAGRTYIYQIKLLGSVGNANFTTVKAYTFPDLSGFNLTYNPLLSRTNSINLSWTNIGYTFVSIQNITVPNSPITTYNYTSNITTYDSSGIEVLSADQQYTYRVTLSNERGDSVQEIITAYTLPTFQGMNILYDVSNSTASSVHITWNKNANQYTSISLQNVDISNATVTSYSDNTTTVYDSIGIDSLSPSKKYSYKVTITGSYSNTNTTYITTYTYPTLDGLNVVYDLSNSTAQTLVLSWGNVGEYSTINIKNTTTTSAQPSSGITYTASSGKSTYNSLTDGLEQLSPGHTYNYIITLKNQIGISVTTSVVGYTLPSLAGFNLRYDSSNSTVNSVALAWTNTNAFTSMTIQNQSIPDSIVTTYNASPTMATYYTSSGKETSLIADVSTTYLITLYNDNGSYVSQSVTAYTLPTFNNVNFIYDVSNSTTSSIQFHWTNTNYTSIRIQNTTIKSPIVQTTYTSASGVTTYDSGNIDILIPSKTYVYTITIYGSFGNTNQTTLTVYTLPNITNTLIAYNYNSSTNTGVVLEWINSGYSTLTIQNTDISGTVTTFTAASNVTKYISDGIDTLFANTGYNYLITAANDAGYIDSTIIRASTLTIYDALHMAYIPSYSSISSIYFTWSNVGYKTISLKNNTISNGVVTTFTSASGITNYDSSGVEILVPGKSYKYLITLVDVNNVVYNSKLVTGVTLPSASGLNFALNRSLSSSQNRYFTWSNTNLFTLLTIQNTTNNGPITKYVQSTKTPAPTFYDSSGIDTLTLGTFNTYEARVYNDYGSFTSVTITDTAPYITAVALSSTSLQITFQNYYSGGIASFNIIWAPTGGVKQATSSSNIINVTGLTTFTQYTVYGVITYTNGATNTTASIQVYTDVPEAIKWYKFDVGDISGSQIKNYGNLTTTFDMTRYNSPTASVISSTNYALDTGSFAVNSNVYFKTDTSMLLNTANSYSISFWVYGAVNSSSGYLFTMYGPNTGYYIHMYGQYNSGDRKYHVSLYNTPYDISMTASAWNHIVLTMTKASGNNNLGSYIMYVNGTQYDYTTSIQNWAYYNNIYDFYIGAYNNGGGIPNGVFIDDFRVFNYQLSPANVSYMYNVVIGSHLNAPSVVSQGALGGYGINVQLGNYSPLTTAFNLTWTPSIFTSYLTTTTSPNMNILGLYDNTTYTVIATTTNKYGISLPRTIIQRVTSTLPVVWYKFDAYDASANNILLNYGNGSQLYDATFSNTNNVISTSYYAVGTASMYGNGNTRLQMNNSFLLNTNNNYSVSCWMYGLQGVGNPLFGFENNIYVNTSWAGGTPAKVSLSVSNTPNPVYCLANQWNHIMLTFGKDISSNNLGNYVLYVNGVPYDLSVYIPNSIYYGNTYRLFVGGHSNNTLYNCYLDDFRIYNYQLTPDQITSLYTSVVGTALNAPTITTSSVDASGIITVVFSNYSPLTTSFNVTWSPSVSNSSVNTTTSNTVQISGLHANTTYTITATTTNKFGVSAAATATQTILLVPENPIVWYKFNAGDVSSNFYYTPGLYFKIINGYADQGFSSGTDIISQNNWYQKYYDLVYNSGGNNMQPYATNFSDLSGATKGILAPNTVSNFMVEWVGYFYPQVTGNYTFNSRSGDFSIIWLYNNVPPNTTPQADMQPYNIVSSNLGIHAMQDASNANTYLVAGNYYPIRIRYGNNSGNSAYADYKLTISVNGQTLPMSNMSAYFLYNNQYFNNQGPWYLVDYGNARTLPFNSSLSNTNYNLNLSNSVLGNGSWYANGSNHIYYGGNLPVSSNAYSVAMWLYPQENAQQTIYNIQGLQTGLMLNLYMNSSYNGSINKWTPYLTFQNAVNTPNNNTPQISLGTCNQWYYVVVTWTRDVSGVNTNNIGSYIVYVNGVAYDISVYLSAQTFFANTTQQLRVCTRWDGQTILYNTYMDDFKMYNYALSSTAIQTTYANIVGTVLNAPTITTSSVDASGIITVVFSNYSPLTTSFNVTWSPSVSNSSVNTTTSNIVQISGLQANATYTITATTTNKFGVSAAATATQALGLISENPIVWYKFNSGDISSNFYYTPGLYFKIVAGYADKGFLADGTDVLSQNNWNQKYYDLVYNSGGNNMQPYATNFSDLSGATKGILAPDSSSNFMIEWVGYFYPKVTGSYTFNSRSGDFSIIWLYNNVPPNTTPQADMQPYNVVSTNLGIHGVQDSTNTPVNLIAGNYYPIRIRYGTQWGHASYSEYYLTISVNGQTLPMSNMSAYFLYNNQYFNNQGPWYMIDYGNGRLLPFNSSLSNTNYNLNLSNSVIGNGSWYANGSNHIYYGGDLPVSSNAYSVAMWLYPQENAQQTIYNIQGLQTGLMLNLYMNSSYNGSTNKWTPYLTFQNAVNTTNNSTPQIPLGTCNQWYYVVVTWTRDVSGVNTNNIGSYIVYVNGVAYDISVYLSTQSFFANTTQQLRVCTRWDGQAILYNTYMDDFRMYNYALNSSAVQSLYTSAIGTSLAAPTITTSASDANGTITVTFSNYSNLTTAFNVSWSPSVPNSSVNTTTSNVVQIAGLQSNKTYTITATTTNKFGVSAAATAIQALGGNNPIVSYKFEFWDVSSNIEDYIPGLYFTIINGNSYSKGINNGVDLFYSDNFNSTYVNLIQSGAISPLSYNFVDLSGATNGITNSIITISIEWVGYFKVKVSGLYRIYNGNGWNVWIDRTTPPSTVGNATFTFSGADPNYINNNTNFYLTAGYYYPIRIRQASKYYPFLYIYQPDGTTLNVSNLSEYFFYSRTAYYQQASWYMTDYGNGRISRYTSNIQNVISQPYNLISLNFIASATKTASYSENTSFTLNGVIAVASAYYGTPANLTLLDVTSIVKQYLTNNSITISVGYNSIFTDPAVGIVKTLTINYVDNPSVSSITETGTFTTNGSTYIQYNKSIPFDSSAGYTVSTWVNCLNNANGYLFTLYSNDSGAVIAPYINYQQNNGIGSVYLTFANVTNTPSNITPTIPLSTTTQSYWHHIAVTITKDPSSNNIASMIFYVNMVPYDMSVYISTSTFFNTNVSLYVGAYNNNNGILSNAFIDNFNLFNTAYNQSQINDLYTGITSSVLVAPTINASWNGSNGVVLTLTNISPLDTSFNITWTPYVGTAYIDNTKSSTMTLYGLYSNTTYTITVSANNIFGRTISSSVQFTIPNTGAPILYYPFNNADRTLYNGNYYNSDYGNNIVVKRGGYVMNGQGGNFGSGYYARTAGSFRFTPDYMFTIPTIYLNHHSAYTFSFFVYCFGSNTCYGQLFMLYNQATGFNIGATFNNIGNNLFTISLNNVPYTIGNISVNMWNHIAITLAQDPSGSNNIGRAWFYLNGVGYDITPYYNTYSNVFNTSTYTLVLNADINYNNSGNSYVMDEIQIYNTEYSASQIPSLYSGTSVATATSKYISYSGSAVPTNWYKFDQGDINTTTMSLLNYGNNTTLYDASFNATPPSYILDSSNYVVGTSSLYLDGNTYFYLAKNMNFVNTNGYTVSFWFNYSNTSANPRTLFYIGNGGYYGNNNNIYANVYFDGANCYINTQAFGNYQNTIFQRNVWNHVVFTFSKNTTTATTTTAYFVMYLNGVKCDFTGANMAWNTFTYGNNIPFYIGNGTNISSNNFVGNIDDFRIYNYNLSQDQVTSIYNSVVGTSLTSNTITLSAIGSSGINVQFSNYAASITTAYNLQWTPKLNYSYTTMTSTPGNVQILGLQGNTTYTVTGTTTNKFGVTTTSAPVSITLGAASPIQPIVWYKFNPGDISMNFDLKSGLYFQMINGYYDRGYNGSTDMFLNANNNYHYLYYNNVFKGYTSAFSSNFYTLSKSTNNSYIENIGINNFSAEWIGYFQPPISGSWNFNFSGGTQVAIWLSPAYTYPTQTAIPIRYDTSVNMITAQSISNVNNFSQAVTLTAGVLYPIRIRYGVSNGGYNLNITASFNGVLYTPSGDFTGMFYSSERLSHTNSGNSIAYLNNYGNNTVVPAAYTYNTSTLISSSSAPFRTSLIPPPAMGTGCGYFDGNTFVSMESPFTFVSNTSYTISMWFHYSQMNTRCLFYLGNNNNIAYDLFINVQYGGYGGNYIVTHVNNAMSKTNIPVGSTWNHIALVLSPNTSNPSFIGACIVYINGVKCDFTTIGNNSGNTIIAYNQPYNFYIGNGTSVGQSNFVGYVDDFRIYNYALSMAEIQTMYANIVGNQLAAPTITVSEISSVPDPSGGSAYGVSAPLPGINVSFSNYSPDIASSLNVTWSPKPYNSFINSMDISAGTVQIVGLLGNTTYKITANVTNVYGITATTTSTITVGAGSSPNTIQPILWYKFNPGDISMNFDLKPGLIFQVINNYYNRGYNGSTDMFLTANTNYHYLYNNNVFNGYTSFFSSNFNTLSKATNNVYIENVGVNYFSAEWIGYFQPPISGSWKFNFSGGTQVAIWLSPGLSYPAQTAVPIRYDTSVNMITAQSISNVNNFSQAVTLTAGVLYPIRIRYGVSNGGYNMNITASCNGVLYTPSGDFTGMFYSSPHLMNNNSGNTVSYMINYGNGSMNANAFTYGSASTLISTNNYLFGTGSAYFDGTNYVSSEAPIVFYANTSYTLSMWFNYSDILNNRTLFYIGNNSNPSYDLWVYIVTDGTNFYLQTQTSYATNKTQFKKGTWTHFSVVFTPSSSGTSLGTYSIFVNGLQSNFDLITQNGYTNVYYNQAYKLFLGNGSNIGTNNYVGYIDDFKIYNKAFTPAEIQQIYNDTVGLALTTAPTITASAIDANGINIQLGNYHSSTTKYTLQWTPQPYRSYVTTDTSNVMQILGLMSNTNYKITAYTTNVFGISASSQITFTLSSLVSPASPIVWYKFNQGDVSGNFALKSGLLFQIINNYYDRGYNGSTDMFLTANNNYHYLYSNNVFNSYTSAFSSVFNTLLTATNSVYLDNRGVNYFSAEWIGYFQPPITGSWNFNFSGGTQVAIWLSPGLSYPAQTAVPIRYDTSVNMITAQSISNVNNFSQAVTLTAGVLYPIRIRYGVSNGGYSLNITASCNGVLYTPSGDFTGMFYSSERLANNNSGNSAFYFNNYGNDTIVPSAYSYSATNNIINTNKYMMGTGSGYFDGTNFVCMETPFKLFSNTSYTFSMWFNYSDFNNRCLFYMGNNSNSAYDLYIQLQGGSNTLYMQSNASYAYSKTTFTRGVWNHLAIVIDPSSNINSGDVGNFVIYLNGMKLDYKLISLNRYIYIYYNSQYSLYLGNGSNIGLSNYIGYIDDFRIYNSSYTYSQVLALYNSIVGTTLTAAPTINITPIGQSGLNIQFTNYSPLTTNWTVSWSPKIMNSYVTTDASSSVQLLGLFGNTTYTITATTTTRFGISAASVVTYTLVSSYPVVWYKFNTGDINNTLALKSGLFFQAINGFYNRGYNGSTDQFIRAYPNVHYLYNNYVNFGTTSAFTSNFTSMRYATNNVYLENQGVNNFNIEWIGYFKPPSSGTWQFFLSGGNQSGVWIDTTTPPTANSVPIYPQGNNSYLVCANNLDSGATNYTNSFTLSAGYYYPIRIRYAQGGGGYDINLTASRNGVMLPSSDFTGYFYSCERLSNTNSGTGVVNYIQNYGNGTTLNSGFTYGDSSVIYTGQYISKSSSNASAYFDGNRVIQHECPFYLYANTSYTFSLWFYYQNTDNRMLFYMGNNSNAAYNLYFAVVSDGTNIYLQTEVNGALYKTLCPRNTWNHLVVSISPNSNNSRIGNFYMYLNNVKLDFSVASNYNNPIGYNSAYNFYIGNGSNVGWTNYSGFIDDFRIYNSALSDAQISQLYNGLM